ncbi:hypothetical protein OM076_13655 [Solirubrobacter ginsenosidimutans]|uniref:Uncharacterized protein n=1 Tax=Solirubrobacter ginsenosidimutans TaxID=490573 RepID=A0A9X3MXL3_9ACTN|nr:hypothetical protein [Solirubrobacter ginsenosidimutans]MDA0161318.1 hypothetical protein [Solirubrobacter ginsenosidimutans]
MSDLQRLNGVRFDDGSLPLSDWPAFAHQLASSLTQADVFAAALESLGVADP